MRLAVGVVLAAVVLTIAGLQVAAGAPAVPERLQVGGREYIRLSDWARANDLDARWVRKDEIVHVGNSAHRLLFTVDSCQTTINGVNVWLSFPVVNRNGAVYVSQLDASATLSPLLFPTRNSGRQSLRSICLDPGHGGKDSGLHAGSNLEKEFTLLLAQEVRQQLNRAGLKATLTRTSDSFVDLGTRPEVAKRRGADLFVSLHFNAAENSPGSVKGAEVYCLTPPGAFSTNSRGEGNTAGCVGNRTNDKSILLAHEMQRALIEGLGVEDRGVRRARYAVLKDAVMPAILIEAGFMSHPTEGRKILDPNYRRQIAKAIVAGILTYRKKVEGAAGLESVKR